MNSAGVQSAALAGQKIQPNMVWGFSGTAFFQNDRRSRYPPKRNPSVSCADTSLSQERHKGLPRIIQNISLSEAL